MSENYLIDPQTIQATAPALPVQVPIGERDPYWYSPVFVLAPARSNSTVVSNMIGLHPELYGFPELGLFRFDTVAAMLKGVQGDKGPPAIERVAGLLRAIAEIQHGEQTDATVLDALHWLSARATWSGAHILDALLAQVSPRIGFEKSPDNSNRDEYLQRLASWYPRARFVHLTRHPVTTARSMQQHWGHLNWWTIEPELFHQLCLGIWRSQHERIWNFTSRLPPDRWIRVRSEDVLNEPEATLPGICRWLGIDDGPDAIERMSHPERSAWAKVGPKSAQGGGDFAFFNNPERRLTQLPDTLDPPEDWVLDPWLTVRTAQLATALGYGATADEMEA